MRTLGNRRAGTCTFGRRLVRSSPKAAAPPPSTRRRQTATPAAALSRRHPFPDGAWPGTAAHLHLRQSGISDGTPLPERVKIERVCNGTPRVRRRTPTKKDTSASRWARIWKCRTPVPAPLSLAAAAHHRQPRQQRWHARRPHGQSDRRLWGCELRAALPGFRSDVIRSPTIHYMDNPDIGTIILHRLGKVDGFTISVVSALAPKDARKAYEKGMRSHRQEQTRTKPRRISRKP